MKTEIEFGWGNDKERLQRCARLSPQKKLEWLYQSYMFMRKALRPRQRKTYWQLRQVNAWGQGDF